MSIAVALILFNRPDTTEQVMREIAKAKPAKLFLIADGPRPDRPDDITRCAAARAAAECLVDWECEVMRRYSESNLGCGWGPAGGISWVFEHVEEAIILEDDCVPHPDFFRFCTELLGRYRDDQRVSQVSGNFHHYGRYAGTESYFFSRYSVTSGGFATWRRAWRTFDAAIEPWRRLRETFWLSYVTGDVAADQFYRPIFDMVHAAHGGPEIHYWDYQWVFNNFVQNRLSIVSNAGLLSNIGFRPDATHTQSASEWANLPVSEMAFPLVHPTFITPDAVADRAFSDAVLAGPPKPSLGRRMRGMAYELAPPFLQRGWQKITSPFRPASAQPPRTDGAGTDGG